MTIYREDYNTFPPIIQHAVIKWIKGEGNVYQCFIDVPVHERNLRDINGRTVFIMASRCHDLQLVKGLSHLSGVDVAARDNWEHRSALAYPAAHCSEREDCSELILYLLSLPKIGKDWGIVSDALNVASVRARPLIRPYQDYILAEERRGRFLTHKGVSLAA